MTTTAPQRLSILSLRTRRPAERAWTRWGHEREDMIMQLYVSNLAYTTTE
jgi:hypothetical protein